MDDTLGRLRDLTEKVSEWEQFNSVIMHSLPTPLIVTNLQTGLIVECNRAAESAYLALPGQMVGHRLSEFVESPKNLWDSIERRDTFVPLRIAKRTDGTTFEAEVSVGYFDRNCVPHAVSIIKDITERRALEKKLYDEKRTLEAVLESVPVGIWFLDAKGNIMRTNTKGREIWGGELLVGPEGYEGYEAYSYPDGERKTSASWTASKVMLEKKPMQELVKIKRFTGGEKVVLSLGYPVLNGDTLTSIIIVNTDITDLIVAQEGVKKSEESLRAILDSVQCGVAVFDLERRNVYWNKYLEELTCIKGEALSGKRLVELIGLNQVVANLDKYMDDAFNGQVTRVVDDCTEAGVSYEVMTQPFLDVAGEVIGVIVIVFRLNGATV